MSITNRCPRKPDELCARWRVAVRAKTCRMGGATRSLAPFESPLLGATVPPLLTTRMREAKGAEEKVRIYQYVGRRRWLYGRKMAAPPGRADWSYLPIKPRPDGEKTFFFLFFFFVSHGYEKYDFDLGNTEGRLKVLSPSSFFLFLLFSCEKIKWVYMSSTLSRKGKFIALLVSLKEEEEK